MGALFTLWKRRRIALAVGVVTIAGAAAMLIARRPRRGDDRAIPAAPHAPVHLAVGESAPETPSVEAAGSVA